MGLEMEKPPVEVGPPPGSAGISLCEHPWGAVAVPQGLIHPVEMSGGGWDAASMRKERKTPNMSLLASPARDTWEQGWAINPERSVPFPQHLPNFPGWDVAAAGASSSLPREGAGSSPTPALM